MPYPPPIYKDPNRSYRIDTCRPQIEAAESGRIQMEALTAGHYPGRLLPRDSLPGISTIGFWDACGPQDWGLELHRNEGVELVFLESGKMPFHVEDRLCSLQPDDLTITRPWQLHKLGDPNIGPGRVYWLVIDVGVRRPNQRWKWPDWVSLTRPDMDELTAILRENEQPVWPGKRAFRECFRKLGQAVRSDRNGSAVSQLVVYLNLTLLRLLEMFRENPVPRDPALTSSQRTVELFLQDILRRPGQLALAWTLESMAEQCGLRKSMFTMHCRKLTNLSPIDYLLWCRLEHACELLVKRPEASVTEIAFQSGFNSSQYFATAFRRRHGCSPREWRTTHTRC